MTGTNSAASSAAQPRLSVLAALAADVAAIDLSTATLPDPHLCKHFITVGEASDEARRMVIMRHRLTEEIDAVAHPVINNMVKSVFEFIAAGGFKSGAPAGLNAAQFKELSAKTRPQRRRLSLLNKLLVAELEDTFPEDADKELFVSKIGTVGYLDHGKSAAEMTVRALKDAIEAGDQELIDALPPEVVERLRSGNFNIEDLGPLGMAVVFDDRPPMQ